MAKKPKAMAQVEPQEQGGGIRNRIVKRERILGSDLVQNERNWRKHPSSQVDAMRGVLNEIGQVGELLAYYSERNGGKLTLIDGHLRSKEFADERWDVAITDLDDAEADKLLVVYDPLSALAEADAGKLDALLREVQTGSESLAGMLAKIAEDTGITPPDFQPTSADEQGRLDEKSKVCCPECGAEFTPK